ncbi:MAG: hypothetical protein DWC04_06670 [Candidatus Poseidoniales archaeon]|nr:MAG: hypothetical protein DWC04_06670 [Candidatus Poseidoniales archaeon]
MTIVYKQRFEKRERHGLSVTTGSSHRLDVFRSTVEVMLVDGVLTREEKRLIIKLASALELEPSQPAEIYEAIQNNTDTERGTQISASLARSIYTKVFEVAIVNASLSRDEFRVLAHLRTVFDIDEDEHLLIETELREIVKEKFEDPNVIDKMLLTLRDSVGLVGDIFETVRKKASDGGSE